MPLTNPNKVVTEERLSEFYGQILPYMGGMPDVLANKFSKGDLYSTDEKMIGCWVDNKPLYRKMVNVNVSISSGRSYKNVISLSDLLIDTFVDAHGSWYDNPYDKPFNLGDKYSAALVYNRNTKYLMLLATTDSSMTINGSAFVYYTKTTDSPIAIGSESDYDSTEKIVGTWFGEDLWQKTFDVTSVADGNIITLDSNCYIKNISGSYFPTSNDQVVPATFWYAASAFITTYCGAHNIVKTKTSGYANAPGKVTLQYTKTS